MGEFSTGLCSPRVEKYFSGTQGEVIGTGAQL